MARTADVHQSIQMSNAFAEFVNITFLTTKISKADLEILKTEYGIDGDVDFVSLPVKLRDDNLLLEYYSRLMYNLFVFFYLFRQKDYIIYTRDFSFVYFCSLLPKWLRVKSKIYFETHKIYFKASEKVSKYKEAAALKIPDYIIPITHGIKAELADIFGISNEQMLVAPSGFNDQQFEQIRKDYPAFLESYPAAHNKVVAVYSGSFLDWKGVDLLIKAIDILKDEEIYFIIVGGGKSDLFLYEKVVEELQLKDYLYIAGHTHISKIINLLKCADIGIIPNNHSKMSAYTSPLKVFEYMAAGLSIVASDLPVLKEVLVGEENAVFFETGNVADLAEKIKMVKEDSILREQISVSNLEKANRYCWRERAKGIVEWHGLM